MLKESIIMSWQNIVGNKMRSFLTILGIVIGVSAIIALITIVQGVIDEANSQFVDLGAGKITIQAYGTPLKRGLSYSEVEELSTIENVSGVTPSLSISSSIVREENLLEDVSIEGKNEVFFRESKDIISYGRGFNILDMESKNKVAVIDDDIQKTLFTGEDPLGENILINGTNYTIVGLVNEDSSSDIMSAFGSTDSNGKVFIPYTAAMNMAGVGNITALDISVSDTNFMDQVMDDVELALNKAFNYKDDSFNVINLDSMIEALETMQNMFTTMLGGIASISLLVGGIGIMNMMLVSVSERTTEIGLRKALGAEPSNIQVQFLIEAIFLSLFGGLIGVILGLWISYAVSGVIGTTFKLSTSAISLGVGFSAGIGIIFGWAPARKASLLNPIDALRSV
ncbi:MAG: ABC transporter permease [Tissierellia bacterium]|nr:ABC transporter permease [Tissierellia bacterium]MDD4725716.1 ABC transporter permease [Tissierellia bacterium]